MSLPLHANGLVVTPDSGGNAYIGPENLGETINFLFAAATNSMGYYITRIFLNDFGMWYVQIVNGAGNPATAGNFYVAIIYV